MIMRVDCTVVSRVLEVHGLKKQRGWVLTRRRHLYMYTIGSSKIGGGQIHEEARALTQDTTVHDIVYVYNGPFSSGGQK